jgi:hypothetical protein
MDELPDAATYAARVKQQLSVEASLNDLDIIEMPDAKKLKRMGQVDDYDSVQHVMHHLTSQLCAVVRPVETQPIGVDWSNVLTLCLC